MFAQTTRMLAQKQPLIQRVRNSSLVEWTCAEDVPGLKRDTEAAGAHKCAVEEHCVRIEAVPRGAVDCTEEIMQV